MGNFFDIELRGKTLYLTVTEEVCKVYLINLTVLCIQRLPWNIRQAWEQIQQWTKPYLDGVRYFIDHHKLDPGKPLSFHLKEVGCFNKEKVGQKLQFGRSFQLGRIGGNFLIVGQASSIRVEDKQSVKPMIEEHQKLFGEGLLGSFGADKGYYTTDNLRFLEATDGLTEFALQKPGFSPNVLSEGDQALLTRLTDRRAGIEALIGHCKQGGQLGKSRMKSDQASLAAGYASVAGFNGRQLIRHISGKEILAMN